MPAHHDDGHDDDDDDNGDDGGGGYHDHMYGGHAWNILDTRPW